MNRERPILLVEDDRLDVKTVERAFERNGVHNPLYVVSNGEEALAFLRNEGAYCDSRDAPRPGLILLDLNLPLMPGLDFLKIYRRDPSINTIPAVVLTTSEEERDLVASYREGIAGYIRKPVSFPAFVGAIKRLDTYWKLCVLPRGLAPRESTRERSES
jgi:CheY-like chemotaxis protein